MKIFLFLNFMLFLQQWMKNIFQKTIFVFDKYSCSWGMVTNHYTVVSFPYILSEEKNCWRIDINAGSSRFRNISAHKSHRVSQLIESFFSHIFFVLFMKKISFYSQMGTRIFRRRKSRSRCVDRLPQFSVAYDATRTTTFRR